MIIILMMMMMMMMMMMIMVMIETTKLVAGKSHKRRVFVGFSGAWMIFDIEQAVDKCHVTCGLDNLLKSGFR